MRTLLTKLTFFKKIMVTIQPRENINTSEPIHPNQLVDSFDMHTFTYGAWFPKVDIRTGLLTINLYFKPYNVHWDSRELDFEVAFSFLHPNGTLYNLLKMSIEGTPNKQRLYLSMRFCRSWRTAHVFQVFFMLCFKLMKNSISLRNPIQQSLETKNFRLDCIFRISACEIVRFGSAALLCWSLT